MTDEEGELMINSKCTTLTSTNFPRVLVQELQVANPAWVLGTSSHGRQCTMSHTMHDSIEWGLSWDFVEAMATSIDSSVPVFLGSDDDARHN